MFQRMMLAGVIAAAVAVAHAEVRPIQAGARAGAATDAAIQDYPRRFVTAPLKQIGLEGSLAIVEKLASIEFVSSPNIKNPGAAR